MKMALDNAMRRKMHEEGFTQTMLEQCMKVGNGYLSRRVNDSKYHWDLTAVMDICDVLGVDNPRELFDRMGPRK